MNLGRFAESRLDWDSVIIRISHSAFNTARSIYVSLQSVRLRRYLHQSRFGLLLSSRGSTEIAQATLTYAWDTRYRDFWTAFLS